MFEKITDNVEIHQTLPDTPNLSTQELKKEWDKGCKIIKEAFNSLVDELNNNMFPIGFRMFVNNDKDYSNHLGFTWKKVAKGRVLVGKDENDTDFNAIGKTGGEKKHIITKEEMPPHIHDMTISGTTIGKAQSNMATGGDFWNMSVGTIGNHDFNISSTGGGQAHNNLQPYEVVNIWERIL